MYTLIFEIFRQITREKNINQRSSPNVRSKLFRLFTSNFDQPENFTFNNQIFYFVRMSKRSRSLKIHPPKYGDPFTNHLVENLAARLLFHFGQCAKLSGIHFPNSEESQTCSIGKRVTLRRPGASLERPSLDRIEWNSFNWYPSKWFLKIFRFQTNLAQFGFHPRQICFICRTIFISSNAVFFLNRQQFARANDSSW